jgi:hypothetical protein
MDPFGRERGQSDSTADSYHQRYSHRQSQQTLPPFRTVSRNSYSLMAISDHRFSFSLRTVRASPSNPSTVLPMAIRRLQQHRLGIRACLRPPDH